MLSNKTKAKTSVAYAVRLRDYFAHRNCTKQKLSYVPRSALSNCVNRSNITSRSVDNVRPISVCNISRYQIEKTAYTLQSSAVYSSEYINIAANLSDRLDRGRHYRVCGQSHCQNSVTYQRPQTIRPKRKDIHGQLRNTDSCRYPPKLPL